jgi:hypothetical protein
MWPYSDDGRRLIGVSICGERRHRYGTNYLFCRFGGLELSGGGGPRLDLGSNLRR